MNNNQYIAALKKALSRLDKTSRNDIVQEIQSHANESGDTLLERFGVPEELAQQYLEGEVVAKPLGSKIWGISKTLFIVIGVGVVALLVIGFLLFWWLKADAFDYADETAEELSEKNSTWISEEWSDNLDIKLDQASVVFYWHDDVNLRYSCKGELPVQLDSPSVTFNRGKCLVYLPKVPTSINAYQSQLVLVRPQLSLDLELKQAELKVAENGTAYRYTIDASRTNVDDLSSVAEAELEIRIKSYEATISEYSY